MNRMPKPVMNSTDAAPKSGSASNSSATKTSSPMGLTSPNAVLRSSSSRRTA